MKEQDNLPLLDELVASLRRVVNGRKVETLYDAQGAPVAILAPAVQTGTAVTREQFLQLLRAWRNGDPDEQGHEWEQLKEVLTEERLLERPA